MSYLMFLQNGYSMKHDVKNNVAYTLPTCYWPFKCGILQWLSQSVPGNYTLDTDLKRTKVEGVFRYSHPKNKIIWLRSKEKKENTEFACVFAVRLTIRCWELQQISIYITGVCFNVQLLYFNLITVCIHSREASNHKLSWTELRYFILRYCLICYLKMHFKEQESDKTFTHC